MAFIGFGIFIFLGILLFLPVLFYGYFQLTGRIVPGVSLAGVDLGGMTPDEALFAIQNIPLNEKVILADDGREIFPLNAAELGYKINATDAVVQAHAIGRSSLILEGAAQMVDALWNTSNIQLTVLIDPVVARSRLEILASSLSIPARDASLKLENGNLIPIPAQNGYKVDIDATLAGLLANSSDVFQNGTLLVIARQVAPQVTDVTPALVEAQRLLSTPPIIAAYDPITNEFFQWSPDSNTIISWLVLTPAAAGPRVGFDPGLIQAYLDQLGDNLGSNRFLEIAQGSEAPIVAAEAGRPVWARIRYRPGSYIVQRGDTLLKIGWTLGIPFWRIQQANPNVDPENLWAGMTLAIPSKDDLLPLPVVANKRIVISISAQRLWVYQDGQRIREELISTGIDRSPTQPGVFQVQTHEPNAYASVWDLYMPNWLGIYEAWPGFMNGIHGLPMLSNGQRLWAGSLGRPASYGCIILNLRAAEWLYNWAENGVVVEIQP